MRLASSLNSASLVLRLCCVCAMTQQMGLHESEQRQSVEAATSKQAELNSTEDALRTLMQLQEERAKIYADLQRSAIR